MSDAVLKLTIEPMSRARLRDLGLTVGALPPGPLNAITDVPGVRVGHCTVSWGGPDLPSGSGPARTGVTAIFPHGDDLWRGRVVAGAHAANGVGELIGISAPQQATFVMSFIMIQALAVGMGLLRLVPLVIDLIKNKQRE